jgi:hypothetical protein
VREKVPAKKSSVQLHQRHDKEDAMDRSTHEFDVERRFPDASGERVAKDGFDDSVVSDDDIPWNEIMADVSSGERGYVFDPADYPSDEAMMAAAEALFLKWAEEGDDEE